MTPPAPTSDGRRLLWTVVGALVLVAVLALALSVSLATGGRQPARLKAIGSVAGICLAGSLAAWFVARSAPADPARAVAAGLGAVVLRLFPPLATLGWLQSAAPEFRDHGAAEWLLIFYLALLATDILLHIMEPRASAGCHGGPRSHAGPENRTGPDTSPEN